MEPTGRGRFLAVTALFAGLTALMTWPAILTPASRIIGTSDSGDLFHSLWVIWWPAFAMLHGRHVYFTDALFAPYGASLVLDDAPILLALLTSPLQLGGLPLAYNGMIWLTFVLSGIAAYGLARECTGNRAASCVAGALFAFASYRFAHLPVHGGLLTTFAMPAFMWAALRAWRREPADRRALVASAVVLALTLFVNHTYFAYGLLLATSLALWLYLVERRPLAAVGIRFLLTLTPALVVAASMLAVAVRQGAFSGHLTFAESGLRIFNGASPLDFVTPSALHPIRRAVPALAAAPGTDIAEQTVFLGLVPLVLIALGWRSIARSRWGRFFAAFGALALLLSLEPVFRDTVLMAQRLFGKVWLIHNLRVPTRFSVLVVLAASVLVAHGAGALQARLATRRARGLLAVALGALVLAEHVAIPVPVTRLDTPVPYERLRREPGNFIVLRLPLGWDSSGPAGVFDSRDLYYQTIHAKRLIGGYLSRVSERVLRKLRDEPALAAILRLQGQPGADVHDAPAAAEAMSLAARWDIRFVVIDRRAPPGHLKPEAYSAPHLTRLAHALFRLEPWAEDDAVTIYRVVH